MSVKRGSLSRALFLAFLLAGTHQALSQEFSTALPNKGLKLALDAANVEALTKQLDAGSAITTPMDCIACAAAMSADTGPFVAASTSVSKVEAAPEVLDLFVDKPIDPNPAAGVGANGISTEPFAIKNSFLVILEPTLTDEELNALIREKGFIVKQTMPEIGGMEVQWNAASQYFQPKPADTSPNDSTLQGLIDATNALVNDPRIRTAAPNSLISAFDVETATHLGQAAPDPGDAIGWAVKDAKDDQFWKDLQNGNIVYFGIMDVGFSPHDDLLFDGLPADAPVQDHGNHVAGIACGTHDNGRGIQGALPRCIVVPNTGNYLPVSVTTSAGAAADAMAGAAPDPKEEDIDRWALRFSQIVGNVITFITSHPEVRTFNLSLGYNWYPIFRINPDGNDPLSNKIRQIVAFQGSTFVSVLQLAKDKGQVIFAAAGNDSDRPSRIVSAKYASPFNWAAIASNPLGIRSGVVVEAHDQNGDAANFTNGAGQISCGGVDILSSIALNDAGQRSANSYGLMSGTSMASPLCAASFELLRQLRPRYTIDQTLDCMLNSPRHSSDGTPIFDMASATALCPL